MEQESKKLRDIEKIVKENKVLLTKQFRVKEIGIFGSCEAKIRKQAM
jgi:predicted nucleotidyltransferase